MARAQVATARVDTAEVRRLVPAVARTEERLDDALEVVLHRLRLAMELCPVGVRKPGPRLRLELVAREVLGPKRERLAYVGIEVGGSLPRDPIDEIQRDVVKSGITKMVKGTSDVVRTGNAVEDGEQPRLERLRAERDAVDAVAAKERRQSRRHRLRIRLDRHLGRWRQGREQALQLAGLGERRRAAAQEDRFELGRKQLALERELRQQSVHVGGVLARTADDGHEVAIAAAVRAERQVDVEVPNRAAHFLPPSLRLSTARNASCGTSTAPTCFIRRLPAFCFSSSLRLRVMSPP